MTRKNLEFRIIDLELENGSEIFVEPSADYTQQMKPDVSLFLRQL